MIYPTDPEAQRQWLEDSIAARLADLKAKVEGRKPAPEKGNDNDLPRPYSLPR